MPEHAFGLLLDVWRAKRQGPIALAERQRARLAAMVAYARENAPYYRALYKDLPSPVQDSARLPVTNKQTLMERFDDWVTDREVTYDRARQFLDDRGKIGERFLGKYLLAATSGTTGYRGIFLLDERTFRVHQTLGLRKLAAWLSWREFAGLLRKRFRTAAIVATGDHFVACATLTHAQKNHKAISRALRLLSVHLPMAQLVEALNAYKPVLLIGYARTLALLAIEQKAGRLQIRPSALIVTAERLGSEEYDWIAHAFQAKVFDNYGATEAMELSFECEYRWHHVNSDWYLLEPVDADYRPTPPGEHSHTALLTNLVNRVQPILRYDLGDRLLLRPDPCPCGNPLPAFRVQGRASEVITLSGKDGGKVALAPLVFTTWLEGIRGVDHYQIVQVAAEAIELRLQVANGADGDSVHAEVQSELRKLFDNQGLTHIRVLDTGEVPRPTGGGKYRAVIPLRA